MVTESLKTEAVGAVHKPNFADVVKGTAKKAPPPPKTANSPACSPALGAKQARRPSPPLSPCLNPAAKEFVPSPALSPLPSPVVASASPSLHAAKAKAGASLPMLDEIVAPKDTHERAAIEALRKAHAAENGGKKISYSVKELFAMRPLNPRAQEYKPSWPFDALAAPEKAAVV